MTSAPVGTAPLAATRPSALRDPVLIGVVGAGLFTLLRLHDPHGSGSYGYCPSLYLTGVACPGCGGLRAVNDLTHGEVAAAVSSNVLAVVLVGVLAVAWILWVVRRWHRRGGPMIVLSARWGYVTIATMVVFGVVRNLPFGTALAP